MDTLNEEELEELAALYGRKLGFHIAALQVSEEVKEAWLTILPEFSLGQLERLLNVFEAQYLNEATGEADEELRKKLQKIKDEFERDDNALLRDTERKIKELVKQI